jgi:hypothetical protein
VPKGKAPAPAKKEVAKAEQKAASKASGPEAPPIDWFYKWIKKEPFGPGVVSAPEPEPIAKVTQDLDDSLDLSVIEATTG